MWNRIFRRNSDQKDIPYPDINPFWSNRTNPFKEYPEVEIRYFPTDSERALLLIPGYMSSGIKPKYEKLIQAVTDKEIASVISTNYTEDIRAQIPLTVGYAKKLGTQKHTVLGSSAGGGAAVLAAQEFGDEIDSLILTAPSMDLLIYTHRDMVLDFTGKVYLIRTVEDEVCSSTVVDIYKRILRNAEFHLIELPGNDHALDLEQNTQAVIELVESSINSLDNPVEP